MRLVDDAPGDRGAGRTHLSLPTAPDDVVRYHVEGEAQPRIVIDPRTAQIFVGNGVVYPTTPLGGGGGVPISLSDEGGLVEASTTALDLVGKGVVATSTGAGSVQVTISGTDRGLLAGRPAASAAVAQMLYVATDVALTYFCDGAAWFVVVVDHGNGLSGLGDDDHTQYHNDARGDARYQPLDSDLTNIAGLTPVVDNFLIGVGGPVWAVRTPAQARTSLALDIGTNVQAWDADLDTIAGLTATSDNFLIGVAGSWASRTPAQARTSLALVIGTNVQAWDADLDTLASLTSTTDNFIVGVAGAWASRTPTQVRTTLGLATTDNPQFATIELGAAADTTLSRSAAGVLAVEGVVVPTISSTNTLTNKRITPRVDASQASSATPTIATDSYDAVSITALATAITSMSTNTTGAPTNTQALLIRIKDNGTARAITWGTSYEAKGVALPTTTVISKVLTVLFIYDTVSAKWGCVASAQEA